MNYELDFDRIKQFAITEKKDEIKYNYERTKYVRILPLPSRTTGSRAEYEDGFTTVTAAILRLIDGEALDFEKQENFIDKILNEGDFSSPDVKDVFQEFIAYEFGQNNTSHSSSLQNIKYISMPESKAEQSGQKQIIEFFYDIYIRDQHAEIVQILGKLQSKGLMREILNVVGSNKKDIFKRKYRVLFPQFAEKFKADLKALSKNPGFLLENLDELFLHYTFVALTQIVLQTNKFTNFSSEKIQAVPYILQQEQASIWRMGYKEGYKRLISQMETFFTHENMLNILAMNSFIDEENMYYHDYAKIFADLGEEATNQYVKSIYTWVNEVFCPIKGFEPTENFANQDLQTAYQYMYSLIEKGLAKEHRSRYPGAFAIFMKRFYRKHGGPLGNILSLNLKQFLLMVAVSVGEKDRIELNELWKELNLRGIELDDDSKLVAVTQLDKLNYIDKKSDSGDAQYVKSIL